MAAPLKPQPVPKFTRGGARWQVIHAVNGSDSSTLTDTNEYDPWTAQKVEGWDLEKGGQGTVDEQRKKKEGRQKTQIEGKDMKSERYDNWHQGTHDNHFTPRSVPPTRVTEWQTRRRTDQKGCASMKAQARKVPWTNYWKEAKRAGLANRPKQLFEVTIIVRGSDML